MEKLNGKIALVTGGSRSLGKKIALKLAEDGADVIITYRSQKAGAEETAKAIEAFGRKAAIIQTDLEGTSNIDSLVNEVNTQIEAFGGKGLDILVNNAGVLSQKPLEVLSEEDLDRQYNTNYKSVVFLTQKLMPHLNEGGRIINLGSGTTHFVFPPLVGYAPIKAAVEVFTKYLAKVLGDKKITANVVSPGALDTDFNADLFQNQEVVNFVASQTALGRVGVPSDVSGVVSFLCSEDGGWVTGQRIEISGGYHL